MDSEVLFKTNNEFSLHIETIASEQKLTYLESIMLYCDEAGIDPEQVAPLVNKSLKDKLAFELAESNYFPKRATLDF